MSAVFGEVGADADNIAVGGEEAAAVGSGCGRRCGGRPDWLTSLEPLVPWFGMARPALATATLGTVDVADVKTGVGLHQSQ